MQIIVTEAAAQQLAERQGDRPGTVRLVYDTEGCGCAVNGVPALWIVEAPEAGDVAVTERQPVIWMHPQQAIFFEDEVKLDYRPQMRTFRLYSDSQTYHSLMKATDRRA
ncbi:iron-sulfur cluster biosynthesis family protein [Paenibacillus chartarius]|uniref:Iron-sulfur cluster biosynthesis family protein n=1 Tax=Paenibacillus chartarius TaxID=747481 RepID=A0ABV6DQ47_9BACL